MSVNTVKDILKQDYNTVKTLKENLNHDSTHMYKKMLNDKKNTQKPKK